MKNILSALLLCCVALADGSVLFETQQVKVHDQATSIKLPQVISSRSGTIRFTFTWDRPDDRSNVIFLQLLNQKERVQFYIYDHRNQGLLALRLRPGKRAESVSAHRMLIDRWRKSPGMAHRVVFTWSPQESRLYLDGQLQGVSTSFATEPLEFNRVLWGLPTVRYAPERVQTNQPYQLGKLEILNHAMTGKEVLVDLRNQPDTREVSDEF